MNDNAESLLLCTGQAWKYSISQAGGITALLVFASSFYFFTFQSWRFYLCWVLAGILSVVSMVIPFTIKCPNCDAKWYWQALKAPISKNGLMKLHAQKYCPTCGYSCHDDA